MHGYLGQILCTNQHSVCRVRWQQWCRSLHDNTERVRADGLGGQIMTGSSLGSFDAGRGVSSAQWAIVDPLLQGTQGAPSWHGQSIAHTANKLVEALTEWHA